MPQGCYVIANGPMCDYKWNISITNAVHARKSLGIPKSSNMSVHGFQCPKQGAPSAQDPRPALPHHQEDFPAI